MAMWQGGPWGNAWEGLFFKRVSEGWVFRSPICWWPFGLGPTRHYLVNEIQKAEIVRRMGRLEDWRGRAILVAAPLVGLIPLFVLVWKLPALASELTSLVYFLLVWLWVQVVLNVRYSRALKSTLVGASQTSERITLVEMRNVPSATAPIGISIYGGLLFTSIFGLLVYEALVLKPPTIGRLIFIILIGLSATYCYAMLWVKLKAKQSIH